MWLALACGMSAGAQVPPAPEPAPAGDSSSFEGQLDRARGLLAQGDPDRAVVLLEQLRDRLDGGEPIARAIAHDALVHLGDAQFLRGEQDEARQSFRRILLENPDYIISPYHHTEDVRAYFALVRDAVEKERASLPPVPLPPPVRTPPLPWWGYAPLGVPQIGAGRTGRGAAYAAIQAGCAAGSIATAVVLGRVNRDPLPGHPYDWTPEQVQRRSTQLKYGVQWPLTLGFYAAWTVSVVDAGSSWKRTASPASTMTVGIGPRGVALGGRF